MENRRIEAAPGDGISGKPREAREELFNLSYDPGERTNVLTEFPEKAIELKALFEKFPGKTEN